MTLFFIGLGLCDERDISVRGLEIVKRCKHVFLEAYTSILMVDKGRLETFYDREVVIADREMVESDADRILADAEVNDVAFLVVGDPFGATTHTDLQLRARALGITVRVIHNASIMNAVGACGLQLYRFGEPHRDDRCNLLCAKLQCQHDDKLDMRMCITAVARQCTRCPKFPAEECLFSRAQATEIIPEHDQIPSPPAQAVSIVFFTETWRPDSFYPRIMANRRQGLHTLCLLDIKVREPTLESLARGKKAYEPPRYMTVATAIQQLLEVVERHEDRAYSGDTLCVGLARVGCEDQLIAAGPMESLLGVDFGPPLHSLVIAGDTHVVEEEILAQYRVETLRAP